MGRAEDLFARLEQRGVSAIYEMLADAKSEEAFLDFKRSADSGEKPRIDQNDKKNLSRALSGFANSDGGLVIWGVGTSGGANGDVADSQWPLSDCRRFASQIDESISWGTVPPVPAVRSIAIPLDDGTSRGFVATLIPASEVGPHQATEGKQYLLRVGAGFQPATHTVLAGMFGRRPQAAVFHKYIISEGAHYRGSQGTTLDFNLIVVLFNRSAVVANDAYAAWEIRRLGGPSARVTPYIEDSERWQIDAPLNLQVGACMARESNRLIPFSHQRVLRFRFNIRAPIATDFEFKLTVGCAGAAPIHDQFTASKAKLESFFEQSVPVERAPGSVTDLAPELLYELFGLSGRVAPE